METTCNPIATNAEMRTFMANSSTSSTDADGSVYRIKRKLCEIGWEDEFNRMRDDDNSFRQHALVTPLRPMTDRSMSPSVPFTSKFH